MARAINIIPKITQYNSEAFKIYLQDVSKMPVLSVQEETKFAFKAFEGDKKALNVLITCNLRFVISVAKLYVDENCRLEDLVGEGNDGLIIAAKRFDPNKGYKFISYAVWWIRRKLLEYRANYCNLVRIPNNKLIDANKLKDSMSKFEVEFNREPSMDEIKELFEGQMSSNKLDEIFGIKNISFKSLGAQIDADGTSLEDVLSDSSIDSPDAGLTEADRTFNVDNMLNTLNAQQKEVITLLFGLNGDKPMTLYEVGCKLGKSRERIRQIKEKAFEHLKINAEQGNWIKHFQ